MHLNRRNFLFFTRAGTGAVVWGAWRSPGLIAAAWAADATEGAEAFEVPHLRLQRLGATH